MPAFRQAATLVPVLEHCLRLTLAALVAMPVLPPLAVVRRQVVPASPVVASILLAAPTAAMAAHQDLVVVFRSSASAAIRMAIHPEE